MCVCLDKAIVWRLWCFLQVLEPFCPLSEQANEEPEELECSHPTYSAAVLIMSDCEINSSALSSDTSALTHKDPSCPAPLPETEALSVPFTDAALPLSLPDDPPALLPPLSDSTSASQQCLCVPALSNCSPDSQSTADLKPQTDPPDSPPGDDANPPPPLSEVSSDEPDSTQTGDCPVKLITSSRSLQTDELCSLQVPDSPPVSLA